MGQPLTRAPVYFAAAQVRHNPIAALNDDARRTAIKERFRKLGYPDQREMQSSISVVVNAQNIELPSPRQLTCLNVARDWAVVIQNDRFWIQTTNYPEYSTFQERFMAALAELHAEVSLDYMESVSMRMLDAIVPDQKAGKTLADYLPPSLLGLDSWAQERNWQLEQQSAEHVFITAADNKVVLRCVRRPGEIGFPPDFIPLGMELLPRHKGIKSAHAVIDSDAGHEKREPLNMDAVGRYLISVKGDLSQCFKHIVTQEALRQWA
ncbi:TIGR04255 family protein [Dyella monticola]|uniref:TIGR04255 family protein n=1 Tax=Dyella monticola TaxID=1927958 RepID=A0A370WZK9_9GAMM|nr:TIGR04255 family protein [Dyella monticola]RDS81598.1 TIGR04255 family protein [Dyella monticola]